MYVMLVDVGTVYSARNDAAMSTVPVVLLFLSVWCMLLWRVLRYKNIVMLSEMSAAGTVQRRAHGSGMRRVCGCFRRY